MCSRCHCLLWERPWCATTCPRTSVCFPSSSQWHLRLRSSPPAPRLSCIWLAWKKCGPSLASLLFGTLMSQVWLLLDCGCFPLKALTWKAGWASQVYPMASDPGLKQSASSMWDTITEESEAPGIGASSAMKSTLLQVPNRFLEYWLNYANPSLHQLF